MALDVVVLPALSWATGGQRVLAHATVERYGRRGTG
jgi:hypothetical protein